MGLLLEGFGEMWDFFSLEVFQSFHLFSKKKKLVRLFGEFDLSDGAFMKDWDFGYLGKLLDWINNGIRLEILLGMFI